MLQAIDLTQGLGFDLLFIMQQIESLSEIRAIEECRRTKNRLLYFWKLLIETYNSSSDVRLRVFPKTNLLVANMLRKKNFEEKKTLLTSMLAETRLFLVCHRAARGYERTASAAFHPDLIQHVLEHRCF